MKLFLKIISITAMIGLVGFTIATNDNENSVRSVLTEEYAPVNENTVNNLTVDYVNLGVMHTSWYGPRFHGKTTANGEKYNQSAFTAAHKSLKFGTLLRVTNLRNNKSVIVRINDRGPYIPGRQMDLSSAAADELNIKGSGVAKIKVEEILLRGINSPLL